jgi:hypothetical protein
MRVMMCIDAYVCIYAYVCIDVECLVECDHELCLVHLTTTVECLLSVYHELCSTRPSTVDAYVCMEARVYRCR